MSKIFLNNIYFVINQFISIHKKSLAAINTNVIAYLSEFYSYQNQSKYLLMVVIFVTMGTLVQSGLAVLIISQDYAYPLFNGFIIFKSWRLFLLTSSTVSLIAVCGLSFLPESPKFLLMKNQHEKALQILTRIHKINNRNNSIVVG